MDRRSFVFIVLLTLSFLGIRYYYDEKQASLLETKIQQSTQQETPKKAPPQEPEKIKPEENNQVGNFYALESPYQQLIISDVGGSIREINLPFHSEQNTLSVVHPTYIDLELEEQKDPSSYFPLVSATKADGSILKPTLGGSYPLLRRSPKDQSERLSSLLLSTKESPDSNLYQVTHFDKKSIVLEAKLPTKIIKKTISFPNKVEKYPYCIDVEIEVVGNKKDLFLSSGVPDEELISGTSGSSLKYRLVRGDKSEVIQVDLPQSEFHSTTLQPDWIATSNGFFALILDPITGTKSGLSFQKIPSTTAPSRLVGLSKFTSQEFPGYIGQIPLDLESKSFKARLYAGPLADSLFSTIDKNTIDDGSSKPANFKASISFHGWLSFISEPFAKFLYFIMSQCQKLVNSWTLSIILTTIVLRILMYPLTRWSQRSMLNMKEIAPQIKAIQERNKKDPRKAQLEIMTLYREKGVNPFSGCLPMLIQMPFLIGMFDLLKSTYELRGAACISGWINDLSQPDRLFSFGFNIPFIGSYFHLLPILLAVVMWWQQKLSTPLPANPNTMTDAERQQKAMGTMMTVVMTVMFYHFPSGLNIYWLSSMLLSVAQQLWTNREFAKAKIKR